jgi:hypothetical protein
MTAPRMATAQHTTSDETNFFICPPLRAATWPRRLSVPFGVSES